MENDIRYIEQFFVGLLEGDGTISANIDSSSETIRVRCVIVLKNDINNEAMLKKIAEVVGGKVVAERAAKYITWFAYSNNDLNRIFSILSKYPLLTVRKQCQLEFAKYCLVNNTATANFLQKRKDMYNSMAATLSTLNIREDITFPDYFSTWLSGFIEAEGNFSLVFNHKDALRKSAFSIGQNDDLHILNMIKYYFQCKNSILMDKKKINSSALYGYYRLSLYNADSRRRLWDHFEKFPLLGQKKISYLKFFNYHNQKINNTSQNSK